jgi:hypothetical protein
LEVTTTHGAPYWCISHFSLEAVAVPHSQAAPASSTVPQFPSKVWSATELEGHSAKKAFDGNTATSFCSKFAKGTSELTIDFRTAVTVTSYTLHAVSATSRYDAPSAWKLIGIAGAADDIGGQNAVVLDERNGFVWVQDLAKVQLSFLLHIKDKGKIPGHGLRHLQYNSDDAECEGAVAAKLGLPRQKILHCLRASSLSGVGGSGDGGSSGSVWSSMTAA